MKQSPKKEKEKKQTSIQDGTKNYDWNTSAQIKQIPDKIPFPHTQ